MKKTFLLLVVALGFCIPGPAEEGMWIPLLLEKLNAKRMQDLGMRLSPADIYSVNNSSLKDAIVQFGGGCTAEFVSAEGLILTNHHCGLGAIQRLSSMENDYITNGFWAANRQEEIPSPGTTVTLLVRMEDVTDRVLEGVDGKMTQLQRGQIIRTNIDKVEKEATENGVYEARVRPFYYGNQYYLMVNQVFRDVRLVGTPPASIGKFGGDTDNWMWPRHTGDFSVFRVYAGKDNNPAAWSSDNVPYRPKSFLSISLKGYQKEDFTFVLGYPGSTKEYLTSYGVELVAEKENPLRVSLREKRLDVMSSAMENDRLVRIQYTAKANGIANFWKKMIGESRGIRRIDAVNKKRAFESEFRRWVAADMAREQKYGGLMNAFQQAYESFLPLDMASLFFTEALQGIEIVRFAASYNELVRLSRQEKPDEKEVARQITRLKMAAADHFKNWNKEIDRRVMALMLKEMYNGMSPGSLPPAIGEAGRKFKGDFGGYANMIFQESMFADSAFVAKFLDRYTPGQVKKIARDPLYDFVVQCYEHFDKKIMPGVQVYTLRIDSLQRVYMAAQMEMQPERAFYPDANSTLRIAYGKVADYSPADAINYRHFTTLRGVMEKENPEIHDYRVDSLLRQRYLASDYGPYADRDGSMHVAFTASNHTTGGNSGSPVLNADGHLIGINFDRNWEGTLSDLMYDPDQCRNIALDIRYCLFVIDKVYGNGHLVEEMKIVN